MKNARLPKRTTNWVPPHRKKEEGFENWKEGIGNSMGAKDQPEEK